MPRLRHTDEHILAKLREAEVALSKGQPVAQVCRSLAITDQTYYRWRNEYGDLKVDQVKRLKELERERVEKVPGFFPDKSAYPASRCRRMILVATGRSRPANTCDAHRSRQFHCHSRRLTLSGTPATAAALARNAHEGSSRNRADAL